MWAPGPVWTRAQNLAPLAGFDLRTVQPVASPYTTSAISTHSYELARGPLRK